MSNRLRHPTNAGRRGRRLVGGRKKIGGLLSSNRGVSAVEFAIIVPVLLVMVLSLYDLGVAMFDKMALVSAVRSGAQYAVVGSSDTTALKNAVVASTNLPITAADVTVTEFCECDGAAMTCGGTCGGTTRRFTTVSASYTTDAIFFPDFSLTGAATVRTQ